MLKRLAFILTSSLAAAGTAALSVFAVAPEHIDVDRSARWAPAALTADNTATKSISGDRKFGITFRKAEEPLDKSKLGRLMRALDPEESDVSSNGRSLR